MSQPNIEILDPEAARMTLSLETSLYPRDVLYAAAYVFLDRAYVLLDRQGDRFLVHLRGRSPLAESALRDMAGEFANELLAQALRLRVYKANQKIIETVTGLAIAGATGPYLQGDPVLEVPTPMERDDGQDFVDDPLGLGKPWEPGREDA